MAGIMKRANLQVLVNLAMLVPFVVLSSILLSHRVAGPLYRVQQALTEIGKGNLETTIQLRRGDELQNIANAVNTMTASLRDRLEGHQTTVQSISQELNELMLGVQSGTATNSEVSKRLGHIQTQLSSMMQASDQPAAPRELQAGDE